MIKTAFLIVLAIIFLSALGHAQCLKYEPAIVKLKGTLIERTFPGPPEYQSIANGDKPETAILLLLDQPICVEGDKTNLQNSEREINVVLVHVAMRSGYYLNKELINKKVLVTGSLYHAITAHHRTQVLISNGLIEQEHQDK